MNRWIRTGSALAVALVYFAADASACSTFCIREGALVFARNYDWDVSDCHVIVNKAGAVKVAAVTRKAARWTSRFGSVTFNQYGCEFPNGGMNEAGLVVELMWLEGTVYPAYDDRPAVTTLQWIQYQLDNCSTVDEVVATDERIRIQSRGGTALHFLVADAAGDVATIEFLDGRLVVHRGDDLPYAVLTNDTYEESVRYARQMSALGGTREMPRDFSSLSRFARAAQFVSSYVATSRETAVGAAFAALAEIAQGRYTVWSIVYDIEARAIHARTNGNWSIKRLAFADLDFGCETPVRIVDLIAAEEGDLEPQLVDYTPLANFRLVESSFSQTSFLRDTPQQFIRWRARYPLSVRCDPERAH